MNCTKNTRYHKSLLIRGEHNRILPESRKIGFGAEAKGSVPLVDLDLQRIQLANSVGNYADQYPRIIFTINAGGHILI